jgi:L-ascorbate metabolism protein UlaG (beta-lactamase superfamily)
MTEKARWYRVMKNKILNTVLAKGQIAIFYLGQESILVKSSEKYILVDGYLTDYVDKNCSNELVKWERKYPSPILPEELDFVDYVFCTHEHSDHTDPYTVSGIAKVNKKAIFIAPATYSDKLAEYGVNKENIIGALADEKIRFDCFEVLTVPAAHEELVTDEDGRYANLGYRFNFGEVSLFHAGDCCVYEGLADRLGQVDVMCLPVNGRSYYKRYVRDIIGNMDTYEAVELCGEVNAKMLIPMHFDLYAVNGLSGASIVDAIDAYNDKLCFHVFRAGEKYIYSN